MLWSPAAAAAATTTNSHEQPQVRLPLRDPFRRYVTSPIDNAVMLTVRERSIRFSNALRCNAHCKCATCNESVKVNECDQNNISWLACRNKACVCVFSIPSRLSGVCLLSCPLSLATVYGFVGSISIRACVSLWPAGEMPIVNSCLFTSLESLVVSLRSCRRTFAFIPSFKRWLLCNACWLTPQSSSPPTIV